MSASPLAVIERVGDGFRLNLAQEDRALLVRLMSELHSLIEESGDGDDPRLARLFPLAYHQPEDAEKNDEYQRLMRDDLRSSRLGSIDIARERLQADRATAMSENDLMAWMHSLNSVRLVLGVILDISEEHDEDDIGDDHPLVREHELYSFLSWLLDASVRALQGADWADGR